MTPGRSAMPEVQISVAVAHTDPLVRAGLAATLTSEVDFDVRVLLVNSAAGPFVFDVQHGAARADVVVADYDTALTLFAPEPAPAANGGALPPRVMVVSHRDRESEIRHALNRGVHGYLLLDCGLDEMIRGVRALHRGQRHLDPSSAQRVVEGLHHESLTAREGDVLRLIAVGHLNKTIAGELKISLGTVKAHVKAILAKLGAKTRTEAASIAQRRGLLSAQS